VKARLKKARIAWAIYAGAAACCYGSKREITDIDIMVKCEELQKAKATLKNIANESMDIGCGAKIKTAQGTCPFFLDNKMMERTNWKIVLSVKVPVMSVEDNVVFKAILQRGKEDGKHDVEDIRSMVAHERVDLQYLRERIRKSHAGRRVNPLLRSLIPEL
jgi:hypothetical protein